MYIVEAIAQYINRDNIAPGIDYVLQDDGDGPYIMQWNIAGIVEPTMNQLQTISDNISLSIELQSVKDQKLEVNQSNYNTIRNGILIINNAPINIDPTSCLNISGQVQQIMYGYMMNQPITSVTWYDDNNQPNVYTAAEFIQLSQTVAYAVFLIQQKLSSNKLAINACATVDELNAIDTDYASLVANL